MSIVPTGSRGLEVGHASSWNTVFTSLLRKSHRYAWGNWSLDPAIRPGQLGFFSPTDFAFTPVVLLDDVPTETLASPTDWHYSSEEVTSTSSDVKFDGGYKDPTTGREVNIGLETTWTFKSMGTIMSLGSRNAQISVPNAAQVMQTRFDDIYAAASPQWRNGDGLVQGFGMITRVWTCLGCIHLGAMTQSSAFSIVGSIDGVVSMKGGDASMSLSGSYKNTKETGAFERYLFPSVPNATSQAQVAYMYEFATFDNEMVLSPWVGDIGTLKLNLTNVGSYIVDCKLTYDLPFEKDQTKSKTVTAGVDQSITDIPLEATNLRIALDFRLGNSQYLRIDKPLSAWYLGQGWLELSGYWPGDTNAKWL